MAKARFAGRCFRIGFAPPAVTNAGALQLVFAIEDPAIRCF